MFRKRKFKTVVCDCSLALVCVLGASGYAALVSSADIPGSNDLFLKCDKASGCSVRVDGGTGRVVVPGPIEQYSIDANLVTGKRGASAGGSNLKPGYFIYTPQTATLKEGLSETAWHRELMRRNLAIPIMSKAVP